MRLGLGLTISLLHGRPGSIDPVEEGADPGVDPVDTVAALPGPVAHDAQQVPGVAAVFDEEAAPRVPGAGVLAELSPGADMGAVHRELLLTCGQGDLRHLKQRIIQPEIMYTRISRHCSCNAMSRSSLRVASKCLNV